MAINVNAARNSSIEALHAFRRLRKRMRMLRARFTFISSIRISSIRFLSSIR